MSFARKRNPQPRAADGVRRVKIVTIAHLFCFFTSLRVLFLNPLRVRVLFFSRVHKTMDMFLVLFGCK